MATAPKKTAAKKDAAPGTAVAVKKTGGGIVDIKAQMAAELASLQNRVAPAGGDKIQLKKTGFHLPNGSIIPANEALELVIVDFVSAQNFYTGKFDPKNIKPPVCFARGDIPSALVPSNNSPELQSDACSSCPRFQFGPNNEAKECKTSRILAVLPPDATEDDDLWVLEVSPTGLKGFDGFVRSVATQFQVPPIGVVVSVSMDSSVDYPKLVFSDPRPNEGINAHWGRREQARTRIMQEPDVSSYEAPAPRGAARGGKVAARGR